MGKCVKCGHISHNNNEAIEHHIQKHSKKKNLMEKKESTHNGWDFDFKL